MACKFSVNKRLKSFTYSYNGLLYCLKTQHNFWIHLSFVLLVIIAGIYFNISITEWALCIFAFALVMGAELFNSSIETLVDIVSPEENKKAGLAKDIAAGAVLVTAIAAAIIGLLIFIPKIVSVL